MLSLNLHFSSFVKHFVYVESQIGKCKYSKFRIDISNEKFLLIMENTFRVEYLPLT